MENREYGAHDRVKRIMKEWADKPAREEVGEQTEKAEFDRAETFEQLVALQKKLADMESKFEAEYIKADKEVKEDPAALKALADIQEQFRSLI